jgi:hypothetical protein
MASFNPQQIASIARDTAESVQAARVPIHANSLEAKLVNAFSKYEGGDNEQVAMRLSSKQRLISLIFTRH